MFSFFGLKRVFLVWFVGVFVLASHVQCIFGVNVRFDLTAEFLDSVVSAMALCYE